MTRSKPLLLAGAFTACARRPAQAPAVPWTPAPAPDLGAPVGRVGEVPIYAAEVAAQAARTGKSPRAALDDLVAFHLLAERARAAAPWPPGSDEASALRKEVLVQRLVEREVEPASRPGDLPDSEIQALYDRARRTFVPPRLVEVAVLNIAAGKRQTAAQRVEARQTMAALKAAVDSRRERTPEDFQALAADQAWKSRRVQYVRFLQADADPYSATFG